MGRRRLVKKIKFEVKETGAPYPNQCWWRLVGSNGRILCHSEMMSFRNAARTMRRVIRAIKQGQYIIADK